MGVRLRSGAVTVVLAEDLVRRRLLAMVDGVRLGADPDEPVAARLDRLRAAHGTPLVVVDRLTDGLDAAHRRLVLGRVRGLASTGTAVLVDDADCVAALAVADQVLRVDDRRGLVVEAPDEPTGLLEAYRAS